MYGRHIVFICGWSFSPSLERSDCSDDRRTVVFSQVLEQKLLVAIRHGSEGFQFT